MTERNKVSNSLSNKDTVTSHSIVVSDNNNFSRIQQERKSILKSIMSDYEKKFINSRRQSEGKVSTKSVNFKDAQSISYDNTEYPNKTLSRTDFKSFKKFKQDPQKKSKEKPYNSLIVNITHNTQNNISIINQGEETAPKLDKVVDFPQFSILRKMDCIQSSPKKKVDFDPDSVIIDEVRRVKTTHEDINDPNFIEGITVNECNFLHGERPRNFFKTCALNSRLSGILEEKEKSISTEEHRRQSYKSMLDDTKYPKTICEKVGYLTGISAISFKNHRYKYINIREVNEDRIHTLINADVGTKKFNVNFLAIYDGHKGERTAEELRSNLHKFIIAEGAILKNPIDKILEGFEKIENQILDRSGDEKDKSGASAITAIFIGIVI
jgi:hypothetical protein